MEKKILTTTLEETIISLLPAVQVLVQDHTILVLAEVLTTVAERTKEVGHHLAQADRILVAEVALVGSKDQVQVVVASKEEALVAEAKPHLQNHQEEEVNCLVNLFHHLS